MVHGSLHLHPNAELHQYHACPHGGHHGQRHLRFGRLPRKPCPQSVQCRRSASCPTVSLDCLPPHRDVILCGYQRVQLIGGSARSYSPTFGRRRSADRHEWIIQRSASGRSYLCQFYSHRDSECIHDRLSPNAHDRGNCLGTLWLRLWRRPSHQTLRRE